MQQRFKKDYMEVLDKVDKNKELREKPVSVQSIAEEQPLTVLENLIKMWPTHDVRYEGWGTQDEKLMEDMVKGAEVRITRKDIHKGILELTVELVKNLDEIERYNASVKKHNREWIDQGSPTTVFDPINGDVLPVRDQYVDPVMMKSRHYDLPDSAFSGKYSGKFANARPNIQRKSHIRVKYQMQITSNSKFVLGYAAYDYNDQVIYYNEVTHQNLAYLVRRSVQEIWGNPKEHWELGALLDGITQLINGTKLNLCKKHNKFPEFMAHEETKVKSDEAIKNVERDIRKYAAINNTAGFYLPITFIFGFIICFFWTVVMRAADSVPLAFMEGIKSGGMESLFYMIMEVLIKPPTLGCILLLILTIYCRKISQEAERKVSELKSKKKFL